MTTRRDLKTERELDKIFEKALELRADFLDEACGDDRSKRSHVEDLLAGAEGESWIDTPLLGAAEPFPEPERIGPYRVLESLGGGGMGDVYLVEHEDGGLYALKLIRQVIMDRERDRFLRECNMLKSVAHPDIVKYVGSGTAADGRPYLVMEHITAGEPIHRFCESHELSVRQRVELFREVCGAVAYAHKKLIVHRDLKPGNILVTSEGRPKLLDFGIAKPLRGNDLAGMTLEMTSTSQRWRPRVYASPEQVRGKQETTASDIFSLGVLLYRLLAGCDPYGEYDNLEELNRRIRRDDPKPPSRAATAAGEISSDLDSIVLQALFKDPDDRYSSVERFSDDLRRWLEDRPVRARVATMRYRTRKFVRRHRFRLAAAILATVILIGSATSYVLSRQRDGALRRSVAVENVLKGVFEAASPDRSGKGSSPIEILQEVRQAIDEDLSEAPDLQLGLLGSLGQVYRQLGLTEESFEIQTKALAIARKLSPGDHPELARQLSNLAAAAFSHGDPRMTENAYREALAMRQRLGQSDLKLARTRSGLAGVLTEQGRYDEAGELYRQVLKARERNPGPESMNLALALRSMATVLYARGDFERAEDLTLDALDIWLRAGKDTLIANARDFLGRIHLAQGLRGDAAFQFHYALDLREKILRDDHLHVARSRKNLASAILEESPEVARMLFDQALAAFAATEAEGWEPVETENLLGALFALEGRCAAALPCLRSTTRDLASIRGAGSTYARTAQQRLDAALEICASGRPPETTAPKEIESRR